MVLGETHSGISELISRYNKWRRIYSYAGKSAPDKAEWDSGRLYFRFGYPHPDWWAFILEATVDGHYQCLRASTERSAVPIESPQGIFARIDDAGKYLIYGIAESLRIDCRLEPVSWRWDDEGLDSQVDVHIQSDRVVKYVMRNNPDAYCIMTRGDMPYSHILPLSYDELDELLLDGFPENVRLQLDVEPG